MSKQQTDHDQSPRALVDASEARRGDTVRAALTSVVGNHESNELMRDYAERIKREPRLSEYELSLLTRANSE